MCCCTWMSLVNRFPITLLWAGRQKGEFVIIKIFCIFEMTVNGNGLMIFVFIIGNGKRETEATFWKFVREWNVIIRLKKKSNSDVMNLISIYFFILDRRERAGGYVPKRITSLPDRTNSGGKFIRIFAIMNISKCSEMRHRLRNAEIYVIRPAWTGVKLLWK